MIFGRQASETNTSPLARARYDREPAKENGSETHGQAAGGFSWAALLQVPLGYEDDTGFHCGEPQVPPVPMADQAGGMSTRIY